MAAERTLLAWIRTGLAMMGFGFVVARFGLFLRELRASQGGAVAGSPHSSLWFGSALVLIGVIVNLSAAFEHRRFVRRLRLGTWSPAYTSHSGVVIAATLAVAGLAVTTYLLLDFFADS
jgi:putative membrane protein